MRVVRFGSGAQVEEVRAFGAVPPDVERDVRAAIDAVRSAGDRALLDLTERFDGVRLESLRVATEDVAAARAGADPDVISAIETAIANVRAVAEAQLRTPQRVTLPQGQTVELGELALRRAGVYVPGGRAAYPSTVVMCATVARVAGVREICVCTPPGTAGLPPASTLAACSLCGVDEVYAVGGAQAIAALALGTESIEPVDVVVGPGNAFVTEAKRQLAGTVAIDGLAGPSELVVVLSAGADAELAALDLLAQCEHGPGSLAVAVCADADLLERVAARVESLAADRPTVADVAIACVEAPDVGAAVAFADALAPEHLELAGEEAEARAADVVAAGCLFVGRDAATAFGDYVAGSNHVLPTGGAARFSSGLSVATFRRTMARVSLAAGAAAELAPAGAALARAEGFPVHAESMERRA